MIDKSQRTKVRQYPDIKKPLNTSHHATTVKLAVIKVIYVLTVLGASFFVLDVLASTVSIPIAWEIGGSSGDYDNFTQGSPQAPVIGFVVVAIVAVLSFFVLQRMPVFKKLSLDTISKSIGRSPVKTAFLAIAFVGLCLLLSGYVDLLTEVQ